jgi:hypothetical protein
MRYHNFWINTNRDISLHNTSVVFQFRLSLLQEVGNQHEVKKQNNQFIVMTIRVSVMVFNATLNNISVISWWSVLLMEETGLPEKNPPCRKSLTNFITYCCIEYTSPRLAFEPTTLVVKVTDCTWSCKSNDHDGPFSVCNLLVYPYTWHDSKYLC